MNEYELIFITKEDGEENLKKITQSIEAQNGKILAQESWGKKKFAYPINKAEQGAYFLWKISLDAKTVIPFKKTLQFNENIMRYLLLKIK